MPNPSPASKKNKKPTQGADEKAQPKGRMWVWVIPLGILVVGVGLILFNGRPGKSKVLPSQNEEPITRNPRTPPKRTTTVASSPEPEGSSPVVVTTASGRFNYRENADSNDPLGRTFESVAGLSPAQQRLVRAERTLEDYLESSKYPFSSQPMSRHRGMEVPNFVPPVKLPLARPDKKKTDARVILSQDRAIMQGDESVVLRVQCENGEGPQPCEFTIPPTALVRAGMRGADAISPSPVPFVAEGDSSHMKGVFTPSKQGFGAYEGAIVIEGQIKIGAEEGGLSWQVMYTPQAPAVFSKKFREVVEEGSLSIYVGLQVNKAGRYVITARGSTKEGRLFAFMQFNDELSTGNVEAKLQIFGKLIHDEKATSPFKIRDIEGFLLRDGGHPDRELMSLLSGDAYTTKEYQLKSFSSSEWESEEKTRHVDHFKEEVENARNDVDKESSK